jgi:hypothetical protein
MDGFAEAKLALFPSDHNPESAAFDIGGLAVRMRMGIADRPFIEPDATKHEIGSIRRDLPANARRDLSDLACLGVVQAAAMLLEVLHALSSSPATAR